MDYDLIIIGAGWAGATACQKAVAAGMKVALIEKNTLGGTCLNRGCIPTKALLQSAKVLSLNKKSKIFGVEAATPAVDFAQVQARKEKIVEGLRGSLEFSLKGAEVIRGNARVLSPREIEVSGRKVLGNALLIACGSKPLELRSLAFDGKKIISSDEILGLKEIPPSLLIIGGGVIGCELASLFNALGSQVTVAELMPQLLPGEDKEVARKLENIYKKKKISVMTGADASKMDLGAYGCVLVCVGRAPDTAGMGLEEIGVKLEKGKIAVDEFLRTSVPGIFAAGDCTGRVMLAHYAAYQGEVAVYNIRHPQAPRPEDVSFVPSCIFTDPEIASVGLKEEAAWQKGVEIEVKKFDFLGSGMARILDETEGFIKIIVDKKSGKILGASLIGPKATELISVITVAATVGLTAGQLKNTIFPHPTLSEGIHEALH